MLEELKEHGYTISPGTLYPVLHNLEAEGLLVRQEKNVEGKLRSTTAFQNKGKWYWRLPGKKRWSWLEKSENKQEGLMFIFRNIKYKGILSIDSLEITGPGITSVVGESGSGKTTLLRLLNKMISPDAGVITYFGKPLTEIPSVDLRRRVVMLSQTPAIFPGTIRDNLLAGLRFCGRETAGDHLLHEILTMVHLQKELDGQADTLSGGEKQRLALARVILMEPDVLLLDEPSAALDEETEMLLVAKLADYVREKNKTLIMVTHAKQVAQRYSDRIIELKCGAVIRQEEVTRHAGNH